MSLKITLIIKLLYLGSIIMAILTSGCKDDKNYIGTVTTKYDSTLEFEENTKNFGTIPSQDTISTIFTFKNKGKIPLLIRHVTANCGCVTPEWSMDIVEPNKDGKIKVTFNAVGKGYFRKSLSVYFNGKDSPVKLIIKGEVFDTNDKLNSIKE